MSFRWTTSPDPTFINGFAAYQERLLMGLRNLMELEAVRCEDFMRANAAWEDDCLPGKEYLRAFAFLDDDLMEVGIIAYYDQELYDRECGKRGGFPFGFTHEMFSFSKKGVISVILPSLSGMSVLDEFADSVMDKVRALLA